MMNDEWWMMMMILGEMTDADKIMHRQHFETDPTDIVIRINPKIWILIRDHFRLKFWCRRKFTLFECSCYTLLLWLYYIISVNEFLNLHVEWMDSVGAFLIPYALMILLIGIPLLFMEYGFGQYFGIGSLSIFKQVCPLFQGMLTKLLLA